MWVGWWIGRLAGRHVPLLVLRGVLAWWVLSRRRRTLGRILSWGRRTLRRVLALGRILPLRRLALWAIPRRLARRGIALLLRPGLLSPVWLLRAGGSSRPTHRWPRLRRIDGGLGLRHG